MSSREVRSEGGTSAKNRRARCDEVLHPVRAHVTREHMLDLSDLAVHNFQTQGDDQRPVILLHDAVEADLVGCGIDGVDFEGGGSFRRANPQAVADADFRGVLGESDPARQRQTGRIVFDEGGEILIGESDHAGAVAMFSRGEATRGK